jgi:Ca2+-transporting ATPase
VVFVCNEHAALTGAACALCNDVVFVEKLKQANPVDKALIAFAAQNGYAIDEVAQQYRRIYDKPFDSEARYMAAGFERGDRTLYFAQGDPEVVLKMCRGYLTAAGSEKEMDLVFRRFVRTKIDAITHEGDIVIALAYSAGAPEAPPSRYALLCLVELENPLRPGVPEVVERLKKAGVRTIMLTGNRPETATGVSRKVKLDANPEFHLTGTHMARMGFADIAWQSAYVSIFARLLPSQKGILVRLFQQQNHVVAMVGDGANDVIALRAADVRISFVENSSPIARRVSQVLINELADLLALIRSARRIRWWVRFLTLIRAAVLISVFLGLYAWMLNWM